MNESYTSLENPPSSPPDLDSVYYLFYLCCNFEILSRCLISKHLEIYYTRTTVELEQHQLVH
jgi:hypothetical protein